MLLQEAPDHPLDVDESAAVVAVDENTTPTSTKNTSSKGGGSRDDDDSKNKNTKAKVRYIPPFYQENYTDAYRKCQDKPGGEWDW